MLGRYGRITLMTPLVIAAFGCNSVPTSSHMQLDRINDMSDSSMKHLDDMSDNAVLHEMALADFHFVPHTGELSGTGEARLDRMAPLLGHYGGAVHYETSMNNPNLVEQRLNHVRDYLKLAGCDMSRVTVAVGMSGGRGMSATQAMKIAGKGTAKGSGAPAAGGPMTGAPMVGQGTGQANP